LMINMGAYEIDKVNLGSSTNTSNDVAKWKNQVKN